MEATIFNYSDFIKSTFKKVVDDYFKIKSDPYGLLNIIDDLSIEYIDDGFDIKCDIFLITSRGLTYKIVDNGAYELANLGRSLNKTVYQDCDHTFIDKLKDGDFKYYFRISFASNRRVPLDEDNLYSVVIKPFMDRLSSLNRDFEIYEIRGLGASLNNISDLSSNKTTIIDPMTGRSRMVDIGPLRKASIIICVDPFKN